MTAFDFLTIGHSNIAAERFVALLRAAEVSAIADVRSTPFSRFCPWFSAKPLAALLANNDIDYLPCGDALGGRPQSAALYCDGVADYAAMARQPVFIAGLERLIRDAARRRAHGNASGNSFGRVCLMCAEREPLDCHRCLLLAPALAARGFAVGHILHDGAIEPHGATERRLLELQPADTDGPDLFAAGDGLAPGQDARMAAAYRRRARAVAYRMKGATVRSRRSR